MLRGFVRVRGEVGPLYLARATDESGEPIGYLPMTGVELLSNPEQEAAFGRLPAVFSFKESKRIYGKQDQATSDFLKKCISVGILRRLEKGWYEKVKSGAEESPSVAGSKAETRRKKQETLATIDNAGLEEMFGGEAMEGSSASLLN